MANTVRAIGGDGSAIDLVSIGHVRTYINLIMMQRKENKDYLPYPKHYYINNLTLDIMRDSGATDILDKLNIPMELHCPFAIGQLLQKMKSATNDNNKSSKKIPIVPVCRRIEYICDDGLFEILPAMIPLCESYEKYYMDVYLYLQQGLRPSDPASLKIKLPF